VLLASLYRTACADDILVSVGAGPQPGADQRNRTAGFDYSFYRFERSSRQHIEVGVSYTSLRTNAPGSDDIVTVSVYPQVTFYPAKTSRITRRSPAWAEPFFFVRALGPSYISDNRLGSRQQAEHFAFQAQVGVGMVVNSRAIVAVSWKHFSNAGIYDDNDGIDVPLVVNVGVRF